MNKKKRQHNKEQRQIEIARDPHISCTQLISSLDGAESQRESRVRENQRERERQPYLQSRILQPPLRPLCWEMHGMGAGIQGSVGRPAMLGCYRALSVLLSVALLEFPSHCIPLHYRYKLTVIYYFILHTSSPYLPLHCRLKLTKSTTSSYIQVDYVSSFIIDSSWLNLPLQYRLKFTIIYPSHYRFKVTIYHFITDTSSLYSPSTPDSLPL